MDPWPAYGATDAAPIVQTWIPASSAEPVADPECRAWDRPDGQLIVALAGRFRSSESLDTVLGHVGSASELPAVRYWSVTDHRWRPLVASASALESDARSRPRRDFVAADWRANADLYMTQTDPRTGGETIYRMRLRDFGPSAFSLEMENLNTVRWWGITLFAPGDLRTVYVLTRSEPDVWSYYSLTRIGGARWLIAGHEGSYINRVVALYRHVAHIQTDAEPPAVR